MHLTKIKKDLSLTDSVYRALRTDLVLGRLAPGAQLKTSELAAGYGVSLAAVREALSRLSSEGLVEAEPQRGFRAAPISAEQLQDLTAVRLDIECMCLRQSVTRFNPLDDIRLEEALDVLVAATAGADERQVLTEEWSRAHAAFHETLVSGCRSAVLLQIRRQLFDRSERYRSFSVALGRDTSDVERDHRTLIDAVHRRDADCAAELLGDHIRGTTRILLSGTVDGRTVIPRDRAA